MTTETFTVNREWGGDYMSQYAKTFTLEELKSMAEALGEPVSSETFTHFLTGLHCDSYADQAEECIKEAYDMATQYDDGDFIDCVLYRLERDEYYQTCYTVFRLWNINLSEAEAKKEWEQCTLDSLAGVVVAV